MKILLIGGTGILSSDIRDYAIEQGYEVFILNRGINKVKNKNSRVKTIVCDIRDTEDAKKKLEEYSFDVVVDFISFNIEELRGTLSVVDNICKQFVFISSATVYGKTSPGERITEEYVRENSDWDYARNKINCEEYLKDKYSNTNMKYTIVRPYVTYSDARIPFAVIPHSFHWTLADRILNDKPIVLWDGGSAICTLTYAKDFAVGVVGLFGNRKAYNEDFHITTDYTLTWKEALQYIGEALGKKNVIIANLSSSYIAEHMPELKGELLGDKGRDREFDNSKIKSVVPNFVANTSFKEGIKNTISFYQKNSYMQVVDYAWNARIDKMIIQYYQGESNYDSIILKSAKDRKFLKKATVIEKFAYYMSLNKITYLIYMLLNKIVVKIEYTIKRNKSLNNK